MDVFLLKVGQSFGHFDIRSPRIFDERDRYAKLGNLGVGTIQFDALGFELLRERLQVFDLEADVIDRFAEKGDVRGDIAAAFGSLMDVYDVVPTPAAGPGAEIASSDFVLLATTEAFTSPTLTLISSVKARMKSSRDRSPF